MIPDKDDWDITDQNRLWDLMLTEPKQLPGNEITRAFIDTDTIGLAFRDGTFLCFRARLDYEGQEASIDPAFPTPGIALHLGLISEEEHRRKCVEKQARQEAEGRALYEKLKKKYGKEEGHGVEQ